MFLFLGFLNAFAIRILCGRKYVCALALLHDHSLPIFCSDGQSFSLWRDSSGVMGMLASAYLRVAGAPLMARAYMKTFPFLPDGLSSEKQEKRQVLNLCSVFFPICRPTISTVYMSYAATAPFPSKQKKKKMRRKAKNMALFLFYV